MNRFYNIAMIIFYYILSRLKSMIHRKHIYLMSTPWHGNLGDQAIILAEYQILEEFFPNYCIIEIPTEVIKHMMKHHMFCVKIRKDDIIVLPGGGNLGSLYEDEEIVHRWVIDKFSDNEIIYMPQSVFFDDTEEGRKSLEKSKVVYGQARSLTIIERDVISYNYAKENFPTVHHLLAPDTVTILSGFDSKERILRDGVCFFLRTDKEKVLSSNLVCDLQKWLAEKGIKYISTDTVIDHGLKTNSSRWKAVRRRLMMARKSRLVITDRYHGTIFAIITNTPVIVFKSYDTKISSGIRWFENLDWVHYAEKMEINKIINLINYYCAADEVHIHQCNECGEKLKKVIADLAKKKVRD